MSQEEKVVRSESPTPKFSNEQLRGPNSSMTTIIVYPKWKKIEENFLKPLNEWKVLANKLCQSWVYRESSDFLSGLTSRQGEYDYGEDTPTEVVNDIKEMKFYIPTSDSQLSLPNWEFDALRGRLEMNSDLVVGFKIGTGPEGQIGIEEALGILNLSCALWELKTMDAILIGASLHKPINVKELSPKDTLKYDPERNPTTEGFHVFENQFLSVAVQHRAFRGIFTEVEDYTEDFGNTEHSELFDKKYYGQSEVSKEIKAIQRRVQEVYYEAPSRHDRYRYQGQTTKAQDALKESMRAWSDRYAKMKKQLQEVKVLTGSLKITTQELAKYLYLSFLTYDLYNDIRICCREETMAGDYRVVPERAAANSTGQESEVKLDHAGSRIVIKAFKPAYKSDLTRRGATRGAFEQRYTVEVGGNPVFDVTYYMDYKYGAVAPVGYDHYGLKHLGTTSECAPGTWPFHLLETFFEVRAHLERQHISQLSKPELQGAVS